jgi:hypothetical protein
MSYQAQTAVTLYSKQTNVKRLRLLLYLADCAGATGEIDPAPNQETLADFIGCSTRTIRTMLNDLGGDGELEQTRVGSGPGNPSAYKITLPMAEKGGNSDDKGGRKAETNTDIFSTFEAFKAEVKAEILELKAEILELKAEKVEAKGGKGGSERRKRLSTESADDPSYDPSLDPILIQEENPYPFVPSPKEDFPELQGPADKRLDAIMSVCGFDRTIERQLSKAGYAAAQLRSYSAGAIVDRYRLVNTPPEGWYWYRDDWRGRKGQRPTPDGILETISLERVPDSAVINGRSSPAPAELSEAMLIPHTGNGW